MASCAFIVVLAALSVLWAYFSWDRFNVLVRSLCGAEAIHIRGVSSAIRGTYWIAIVERDPWGGLHAYRYPGSRIGHVDLNADGTGEYCGAIEWKPVRPKPLKQS